MFWDDFLLNHFLKLSLLQEQACSQASKLIKVKGPNNKDKNNQHNNAQNYSVTWKTKTTKKKEVERITIIHPNDTEDPG